MSRDPLLTIRQLAQIEGLPESKVRGWAYGRGTGGARMPTYKINGVRVRASEYQAWLESRRRR